MIRRLGWSVLWGQGGYALGVAAGVLLVWALSGNRLDKDLEMVMTGFFFAGPLAGGVASLAALVWPRRTNSRC